MGLTTTELDLYTLPADSCLGQARVTCRCGAGEQTSECMRGGCAACASPEHRIIMPLLTSGAPSCCMFTYGDVSSPAGPLIDGRRRRSNRYCLCGPGQVVRV